MKTRLELWLPKYSVSSADVLRSQELLAKLKRQFKVQVDVLESSEAVDALKAQLLIPSVWHRIRFPQTRKGKNLYPILVVRQNQDVVTFFPQRRGREEITMAEFLEGLSQGKIRSLHPISL